jgi:5-carboxymethyl-2-hydroxymuconate isomerase
MPHLNVEYSANLEGATDIDQLLGKACDCLLAQREDGKVVFPPGGIRARAVCLTHYRIADGLHDDAFVHLTLKIGSGRSDAAKKAATDALFAIVVDHFAELYAKRYLALSMELSEFSEGGTYKHNNLHARYKKT